jgi:hypothetical protein
MRRFFSSFLLTMLLLSLAAAPLFSFDWGVVLDNSSSIGFGGGGDAEFTQRDKLSLWAEHFWSGNDDSQYIVQFNGFYLYTNERAWLFDFDRLDFRMKKAGIYNSSAVLDLGVGRFRFSDTTATVLNHTADGVSLGLDISKIQISAAAGYTGFLLKPENGVEMSGADAVDSNDSDVYFAPKRLFEQLTLRFPQLVPRQRLTMETLFQQDLRETEADRLGSTHLTVRADGALPAGFYYDVSATGGFNHLANTSALMTRASVSYFNQQMAGSRVSLGMVLTGEDFLTVSTPSFGLVYTPPEADLLRFNLNYSARPWQNRRSPALQNLQFLFGIKTFAVPGESYTGTEIDGGVNFRPTSDFGASLKGGLWMPDGGDSQGLLRFEFSLGL